MTDSYVYYQNIILSQQMLTYSKIFILYLLHKKIQILIIALTFSRSIYTSEEPQQDMRYAVFLSRIN